MSIARIAPLAIITLACSAFWPGEPGSPEGGRFCIVRTGKPKACYATEAEQSVAQNEIDKVERETVKTNERLRQEAQQVADDRAFAAAQAETKRLNDEKQAERERVYGERRRKQQEADDAKAARAAEIRRLATDPVVAGKAISAIVCSIETELVRLRADLDKEKRTSAVSGAVDLRARHELAADIVSDTDEIKGWQAALLRLGAKRLPCSEVAPVVACRNAIETCAPAHRDAVEVWAKEQATLWGSDAERPER